MECITRLRPHISEEIFNTLISLRSNTGIKDETIKRIGDRLQKLAKFAPLNNPTLTGLAIAEIKESNDNKNKLAYAYKRYCDTNGIQWKKPYYKITETKQPRN